MVSKSYIYRMFARSPVKPLQQHMEKVVVCARELNALFEAVVQKDHRKVKSCQKRISKLETEADVLKKELRLHLPTGIMLPVSRQDLLEVLTMQDRIANKSKDIAGLIVGRKMQFPEEMHDSLRDFVKRSIDAVEQAETTVNELDELVETGFKGSEVKLVQSMIEKLDEIESDTDRIQVDVRATLFQMEKDMPPVDVMFIYKVIEWIGDLADLAQRVGSRLQLLLAR
ncbi:MAG: TIGR00153 family protein [Gammaproteobacteria bacterium]|nr:TIGR00153 family protein [Gammaproteobacteria bacterium]MDH5728842.1 TIGR00153 family protein [Gammaproteobacteria bacterium]